MDLNFSLCLLLLLSLSKGRAAGCLLSKLYCVVVVRSDPQDDVAHIPHANIHASANSWRAFFVVASSGCLGCSAQTLERKDMADLLTSTSTSKKLRAGGVHHADEFSRHRRRQRNFGPMVFMLSNLRDIDVKKLLGIPVYLLISVSLSFSHKTSPGVPGPRRSRGVLGPSSAGNRPKTKYNQPSRCRWAETRPKTEPTGRKAAEAG